MFCHLLFPFAVTRNVHKTNKQTNEHQNLRVSVYNSPIRYKIVYFTWKRDWCFPINAHFDFKLLSLKNRETFHLLQTVEEEITRLPSWGSELDITFTLDPPYANQGKHGVAKDPVNKPMLQPEKYVGLGQQNCKHQNTVWSHTGRARRLSQLGLQRPLPEWHFLETLLWASSENFPNWGHPFATICQSCFNCGSFNGGDYGLASVTTNTEHLWEPLIICIKVMRLSFFWTWCPDCMLTRGKCLTVDIKLCFCFSLSQSLYNWWFSLPG